MKLGLVTYNMAKDWDIPTIIENCVETGFAGVELRTTHAHGVEVELSASERAAVKQQFDDSPIEIAGLGSAFDYHAVDQDAVRQNIEGTKLYSQLAADVGAPGVKVRPNGTPRRSCPVEKNTGNKLDWHCESAANFAADLGVQIRLEVHGGGTSELRHIRTIIDVAAHENVYVCWNSNFGEVENGSIQNNFNLVKGRIGFGAYHGTPPTRVPVARTLYILKRIRIFRFTRSQKSRGSSDPLRVMNFYRALWEELSR